MSATSDEEPAKAGATPAATGARPVWPEQVAAAASVVHAWLMRPRVRLCLIGATLLLVGALIMTNSVWTLPVVVIGALMVAVAWIGHRLEGHFAIEWGEAGTQLAFNATVKAPQRTTESPALAAPAAVEPPEALGRAEVIEGEAHTVEIDVGELRALIAAAEAGDASVDPVVQDIRIRRVANADADADAGADAGTHTPRPAA